jgi:hypothetical protein
MKVNKSSTMSASPLRVIWMVDLNYLKKIILGVHLLKA